MNKVDFIIVGQGLAGTLLAYDLISNNKKILIIDKNLKASSSKVAAGMINPVAMKRCSPAFMADHYLPNALKVYRDLELKLNSKILYLKPILKLFANEDIQNTWKVKYSNDDMDKYISSFSKSNEFSFLKNSFGGAVVEPSAHLDVSLFLNISRDYFTKLNLLKEEIFSFEDFDHINCSYRGVIADKIIFCEGHRLQNNPFFNYLPMSPTKGEIMRIKIPSLKNFNKMISKGIYMIPVKDYEYVVGATYNREDLSDKVTQEGRSFLISKLDSILDVDFEVLSISAGVRPNVKDRRPLIGVHPEFSKLYVFNGLGSRGVLQGPTLSQELMSCLFSNHLIGNKIKNYNNINRFD